MGVGVAVMHAWALQKQVKSGYRLNTSEGGASMSYRYI